MLAKLVDPRPIRDRSPPVGAQTPEQQPSSQTFDARRTALPRRHNRALRGVAHATQWHAGHALGRARVKSEHGSRMGSSTS